MAKFLVDVNLPYYFGLWRDSGYIFVKDLNDEWSDSEVWNYAKENDLTIITKDADFSSRMILDQPPPKVIHIRIGNMKISEMFIFLNLVWNDVIEMSSKCKLVNVYKDRIEGVN